MPFNQANQQIPHTEKDETHSGISGIGLQVGGSWLGEGTIQPLPEVADEARSGTGPEEGCTRLPRS